MTLNIETHAKSIKNLSKYGNAFLICVHFNFYY